MRFFFIIFLVFIFSLNAQAIDAIEQKEIIVVFRFDDYSARSSTEMEVKLIDAFQKYNLSCTFGVIPYICAGSIHNSQPQAVVPLTPTKAKILIDSITTGTVDVALHGYSHQTNRERGEYSEFVGLDYNSQIERIAKGKYLLEEMLNTQITTFIPPWNSYDLNTIRALEELNFKCVSAGAYGAAKESSSLKFLPCTCGLPQMRDAIETARLIPEAQSIIVVLFHEYDFHEVDAERGRLTYQEFIRLLDWLTSQKDVRLVSVNQATKIAGDLSTHRFINCKNYYRPPPICPPFLVGKLYSVPTVYLSPNLLHNMKLDNKRIMLLLVVSIFYLATLLVSVGIAFFAGFVVFPKSRFVTSISMYCIPVIFALLSIYALRDFELGYKGAMAMVMGFGAWIGVWGSFFRLKKQGWLRAKS